MSQCLTFFVLQISPQTLTAERKHAICKDVFYSSMLGKLFQPLSKLQNARLEHVSPQAFGFAFEITDTTFGFANDIIQRRSMLSRQMRHFASITTSGRSGCCFAERPLARSKRMHPRSPLLWIHPGGNLTAQCFSERSFVRYLSHSPMHVRFAGSS